MSSPDPLIELLQHRPSEWARHGTQYLVEARGGSGSYIPGRLPLRLSCRMAIAGRLDSHFPMKYRAGAASARLLWDEAPATVILGRPESVRLQQWAGGTPEGGKEAVGSDGVRRREGDLRTPRRPRLPWADRFRRERRAE
jgi:hypothetical protein